MSNIKITSIAILLIALTGCESVYTGRNDPFIQFVDQPTKHHQQTPRQRYFSNKLIIDRQVECIA